MIFMLYTRRGTWLLYEYCRLCFSPHGLRFLPFNLRYFFATSTAGKQILSTGSPTKSSQNKTKQTDPKEIKSNIRYTQNHFLQKFNLNFFIVGVFQASAR